jgi:hypothetical protein
MGAVPLVGSPPIAPLPPVQLGFGTSRWWLKETLPQACAQAEGGIIFFSCRARVRSWHHPAPVLVGTFAGGQPMPFGALLTQSGHYQKHQSGEIVSPEQS